MTYTQESLEATLLDLNTVESSEELANYIGMLNEEGLLENEMIQKKLEVLNQKFSAPKVELTVNEQIAMLQEQIAKLTSIISTGSVARPAKVQKVKVPQRFEIVGFDKINQWTKKQQVFALADILKSTFGVGAVVTDNDIAAAVESQVGKKLQTSQTGKRIWDYYKGNSNDGFLTHGCIRVANEKQVTHTFDPETNKAAEVKTEEVQ